MNIVLWLFNIKAVAEDISMNPKLRRKFNLIYYVIKLC